MITLTKLFQAFDSMNDASRKGLEVHPKRFGYCELIISLIVSGCNIYFLTPLIFDGRTLYMAPIARQIASLPVPGA